MLSSIQGRSFVLLVALATSGAAVLALSHAYDAANVRRVVTHERDVDQQLLDTLVQLRTDPPAAFVYDYSYWDDMVAFVGTATPDEEWGAANLQESLDTYHADVVWVLRPDGTLFWTGTADAHPELRTPPWTLGQGVWLREQALRTAFLTTPRGVVELHSAAIVPTTDKAHAGPPRGWLLTGVVWDAERLAALSGNLDAESELVPVGTPPRHTEADALALDHPLPAAGTDPQIALRASFREPLATQLTQSGRDRLRVIFVVSLLSSLLAFIALRRWVVRPLEALGRALADEAPGQLSTLATTDNELGRLARLIIAFFAQKRMLEGEIVARQAAESRLHHLALHDPLTGLPNRLLLEDRLGMAMEAARREEHGCAIFLLDLDHFKQINDTMGHAAGDEVLRQTAERLSACVRGIDTVARLGGDEFVVVANRCSTPEDAGVVADRLLDAFEVVMEVEGKRVRVTPSVGFCLYPRQGTSMKELFDRADAEIGRAHV